MLAGEFLVLDPFGLHGIIAQAAFLVFFVVFEVSFEPFHMRLTFKCQDMRANPVKKKAVV